MQTVEDEIDDSVDLLELEIWSGSDFAISPIRCAAHTLQLAIKDALKKSQLTVTIENARRVSIKLRTPNVAILLKEAGLKKHNVGLSNK